MAIDVHETTATEPAANAGRCPFPHGLVSQQKTTRTVELAPAPIAQDEQGTWHIYSYEAARSLLRSQHTKQAGFKADLVGQMPRTMNQPILYQEGKPHHEQRKQTAKYFTPRAVSENYRELMERYADEMIATLRKSKQIDLSTLSMKMAVRVAAEVVGLTNSRVPGMDKRLDAFFAEDIDIGNWSPRTVLNAVWMQSRVAAFFYLDVKPAIAARRKQLKDDVISHLIGKGYSDAEILTECITYGAAGMATTREFICVAAWHLLEQPVLRQMYVEGNENERQHLLHELLRLEPVVAHLYRRTTAPIAIDVDGERYTIPDGSLVNLHISRINTDETATGNDPLLVCPARELASERIGPAVMSFGDGAHRCPGAYIAIQESDIFLHKLLSIGSLRIEQKPTVSWHDLIGGYEIRHFLIGCE